jgi:hypothetical protein
MNRPETGKARKDRVDDALRAARGRRKARRSRPRTKLESTHHRTESAA